MAASSAATSAAAPSASFLCARQIAYERRVATQVELARALRSISPYYRAHQRQFIASELKFAASPGRIINHELGSGKTLTVIGAIESLRQLARFKNTHVLVLTSRALVEGFKHELAKSKRFQDTKVECKCCEALCESLLTLFAQSELYHVMTVQRFYLNPSHPHLKDCIMVIDEAHMLRNPKSKRYRVLFQAAKQVQKMYLLSGTLSVNYSVDIAPLLNLILSDTTRERVKSEKWLTNSIANEKAMGYLPMTKNKWDALKDKIDPYTKCLVSYHAEDHDSEEYKTHFPNVVRHTMKIEMTPEHCKAYKELMEEQGDEPNAKKPGECVRALNQEMEFSAANIREYQERIRRGPQMADTKDVKFLAYVMKMRMACNHLTDTSHFGHMPKIMYALHKHVIPRCKADPTYKATITSNFIAKGIRKCQRLLEQHGIRYSIVTGQTDDVKTEADIQRMVNDYNENRVQVMLFSSAGAHGLDLHGTTESHIIEPHWNRSKHKQAEARVIRYDSHKNFANKTVHIYYYIAIAPEGVRDRYKIGRTADMYLHELGLKKEEENQWLNRSIPLNCIEQMEESDLRKMMPLFKKNRDGGRVEQGVERPAKKRRVAAPQKASAKKRRVGAPPAAPQAAPSVARMRIPKRKANGAPFGES